jgi:hypothetical protein
MKFFVIFASLLTPLTTFAHISYTNRNFGTLVPGDPAVSIVNQTVTSNYGWADGTDADYGDAHKMRPFRFNLATAAHVTLTFSASTNGGTRNGGLLPGFSVYKGLAKIGAVGGADYDFAAITAAYLAKTFGPAKEGALVSLGDWKAGNDAGTSFADLSSFTFVGYAADGTAANFGSTPGIVGDGNANGTVTGTFFLEPGDYTVLVGGTHYNAQFPTPDATTYGLTGSASAAGADTTAPLATIVPVSPDPRTSPVNSMTIVFNEPVQNFDLSDLTLTRDNGPNLIDGSFTLTTVNNATFTLTGTTPATVTAGTYRLNLLTSNIQDLAGNALAFGGEEQWLTETEFFTASQVQALHVGTPLLQRNPATGEFTLKLGVRKSTTLNGFSPLPMTAPQTQINAQGQLEFRFTSTENAAFFRVEAE